MCDNPVCDRFLPLIHLYLDDCLPREALPDLLAHLDSCERCRRLMEDYRRIAGELRALPPDAPLTLHRDIMGYVGRGGAAPWWRRRALRHAAAVAACAAVLTLVIVGSGRLGPAAPDGMGTTAAQMSIMDARDNGTQAPGQAIQRFSAEAEAESELARKEAEGDERFSDAPFTVSPHMQAQAESYGAAVLLAAVGDADLADLGWDYTGTGTGELGSGYGITFDGEPITLMDYGEQGKALMGQLEPRQLEALLDALSQAGFGLRTNLLESEGAHIREAALGDDSADGTVAAEKFFIILSPLP